MKAIKLNKQKHNEPKFDELYAALEDLNDFLNENANPKDKTWTQNFKTIIDFQDEDGSFKLFDSYKIPSDARVDFCYLPTYLCSAILIKAYLTNPSAFTEKEKSALSQGLKASCAKNLRGHGYEALKGQIEALNLFKKAGLKEFIDIHPDICPEFSEMISKIVSQFQQKEAEGNFTGPWGESYEEDIKSINEYFCQRLVFVYGTLMTGEANHHFLENSKCLGRATIEGYDMYNVGWYPAIIPGDSLIIGELYQVPINDVPSIDRLEGEGSLYAKKCETVTCANGKTALALVYVFLRDCSDLERISSWKDYVWYVSYGSNILKERFLKYIQGGSFETSRPYPPCSDTSLPVATRAVEIPHDMYFGKDSGTWSGGVSFLDTTQGGYALGVAYLITKEQFNHVAREENCGRNPGGGEWYEDIVYLGKVGGIEVITLTNENLRPYNTPSQRYWNILFRGIKQNWPEMTDEEIEDYLASCIRG